MVIVFSVLLAAQPTGLALAACSGSGCTGKDPATEGCASSTYTVGTNYAGSSPNQVKNENRYSTGCVANWGRVTATSGSPRYIKEDTYASGAPAQTYPLSWIQGVQFYTNMIDGNLTVCTVGYIDANSNGSYETWTSPLCY